MTTTSCTKEEDVSVTANEIIQRISELKPFDDKLKCLLKQLIGMSDTKWPEMTQYLAEIEIIDENIDEAAKLLLATSRSEPRVINNYIIKSPQGWITKPDSNNFAINNLVSVMSMSSPNSITALIKALFDAGMTAEYKV
jgi:hypothetical protein